MLKPIMTGDPETQSARLTDANVKAVKALFPEAVTEGRIDFEVLRQLLGDQVDEREEKYGLNWNGKRQARRLALTPSTGTLRPCPDESVDWDTTKNLMIEGDNLEVLKLLQKSYAGEVKLIYIDPPYNTGKDFVYPDDYRDNIRNYLERTGQVDDEGRKNTSNAESSGRFHTDWLNMMYPRLKLARNLLREDGVLAVSIDDSEISNTRRLLDEIFGEEQFQAQIIVQSNKRGQTYKQIAKTHEFLVIYSKSESLELNEFEKENDALPFTDTYGAFDLWELRNRNPKFGKFNRPNLFFPIYVSPTSLDECGYSRISLKPSEEFRVKVLPRNSEGEEGCWRWGTDKIAKCDLGDTSPILIARQRRDGEWNIYEKSRKSTTRAKSIWAETELINEQGTIELGRIEMGEVFDHPKPIGLLQRCVYLATSPGDLVMDFFAGSGTTGHAIWSQNTADGGSRQYILVQLPERLNIDSQGQKLAAEFCDKIGRPRNIAELTKERLRRAGKKIHEENPLFPGDLGFRVFKLDASNIRAWDPNPDDIAGTLLDATEHLQPDRSESDILFELLLKQGLELTVPIEERPLAGKNVSSIGGGTLFACLAPHIATSEVEPLALGIVEWFHELKPEGAVTVFFRDSAFADDVTKTNLAAILEQDGIAQVRSL